MSVDGGGANRDAGEASIDAGDDASIDSGGGSFSDAGGPPAVDAGAPPVPDAGVTAPDAGSQPLENIGDSCTSNSDCRGSGASCLTSLSLITLPGGYCSASCEGSGADCGARGDCVQVTGLWACARTCSSEADCRVGYRCGTSSFVTGSTGSHCIPSGVP